MPTGSWVINVAVCMPQGLAVTASCTSGSTAPEQPALGLAYESFVKVAGLQTVVPAVGRLSRWLGDSSREPHAVPAPCQGQPAPDLGSQSSMESRPQLEQQGTKSAPRWFLRVKLPQAVGRRQNAW
ncbi:hypothetical protein TREES_T100007252 [Tupaia chinensis]|uniref:Uncharacterized protein n=1 Tax=Tupaia chinensis TaxID=246437 RepID=L9L5M1_TUPCH|nr:hypothetical protein TREES_T100007252 [Tupaia chinensis]